MARRTWYRLDNIGKFYSSQAGRSSQTVFRYSAELADGIDPDILHEHESRCVRLPMVPGMRSLNLSNAVAIAVYDALRQQGFPGLA